MHGAAIIELPDDVDGGMQAHSFYLGIDDFVLRIGKEGLNNVCVMKNRG